MIALDTKTDRRTLLAGGLALGALLVLPRWAHAATPGTAPVVTDLQVSPTRRTQLFAWTPPAPKGVILFSHGHGSWPDRYQLLGEWLAGQGYAVLAPMHVDSMHFPDRAKFSMQASFGERIADMGATARVAAERHAGLPVGAVGHSFGTLVALCLGGGMANIAPFRMPAVKTVLGFSSPGNVPGFVTPASYASVETPVLIVSGTSDVVPGLVTDPADHLLAAKTAKGTPRADIVLDGAGHDLVADPAALAKVEPIAATYLKATLLGDRAATAALAGARLAAPDRFVMETR